MKYIFTVIISLMFINMQAQVPVVSPISGQSAVCANSAITVFYSTSATNSPIYFTWWYVSSTYSATLSSTSNVAGATFYGINQTYTLYCTATNASGTSATQQYVVSVFETPNITFSGSNTFCQGSSTSISASSTIFAASSTVSYNWAPNYGLNTTSGPDVIANPSVPTNYTVTAINGVCSNTAQINVTPFELMNVTFSGATTFCQGSSTSISASTTILGGSSTISYNWAPSIGLNTTYGPNVIAAPNVQTTYTVIAYLNGSCSISNQITITPNGFSPSPITALASNTNICLGDSITLIASGASTYTWSNGIPNGASFTPYYSNTYYVSGTDNNGCTGSSSVSVNVNQSAYFYVYSLNNPIQTGQSATLTINGSSGSTYYMDGVPTNTDIVISPTVTTTYTFTSVNSSGCSYTYIYTQYVGFVLGVENLQTLQDYILVYPNPSDKIFNIKSSNEETIYILNQLGETVKEIKLLPETEQQVSDLSSGIYIIHSTRGNTKIIVTH